MRWRGRGARRRHPASRADLDFAALWEDDADADDAADAGVDDGGEGDAPDDTAAGITPAADAPAADAPAAAAAAAAPAAISAIPSRRDRGGPAGRGPGGGRRQAAGVVVLAALLAAALFADRTLATDTRAAAAPTPGMPTMAAAGSLSSTWYCPALGASAASRAKGRLILANPGPSPLTTTVTIVPSTGNPVIEHPALAPYSRSTIRLEDVAPADYAAATVVFDGTGGAVEQEVDGALGQSMTACASSSSDRWYFATGATDANAAEYLSLYNPYPAPAIADLRFETDQGLAIPDAFQGVVVPGGGFTVIDIGARVRSRSQVSAEVDVRGGRLVVDKLQILTGPVRPGPRGLVLTLGAPALGTTWYYANGGVGPGVTERFDVYNPGLVEADVSAAPVLDQGSADPFDVTVPPESMVSLQVDQQARIPPGVGQAWVLTSANGVPVVVERVITSGPPAVGLGVSDAIGAPATATRWVFPAGSAANGADEWLVVLNPGAAPAHVAVVASGGAVAVKLPPLVVAPGSREAVDIGTVDPAGVVVLDVTGDVPIVAERAQYVTAGPGISGGTGIAAP